MTCDSMSSDSQHDAEVVPGPAEPHLNSMRWPLIRPSYSKPLLQALTLLPNGAAAATAAAIARQAGLCCFQCSSWCAAEHTVPPHSHCTCHLCPLPTVAQRTYQGSRWVRCSKTGQAGQRTAPSQHPSVLAASNCSNCRPLLNAQHLPPDPHTGVACLLLCRCCQLHGVHTHRRAACTHCQLQLQSCKPCCST